MASLIEVIDQLDAAIDTDRFTPPCIFAEGGPDATPDARALVCDGNQDGPFVCPQNSALTYVLDVDLAKDCVVGWSLDRGGRRPTATDKFAAVMDYARHYSWLPLN